MKIAILGGGISGLSAAWFLRKKYPDAKMILFEKEKRLGGLIGSYKEGDFFFEKGPRIFPVARSPHLIQLICEVGLKEEMIFAPPHATKRYLWTNGAFRPLSSFALRILFSLVKEPFQPKGESEDESIASFGRRRFGRFLTETLIDPMALGIYGGDIEKLSIRSCFPSLFSLEKKKGRLFPHLLFQKKGERQFFTLRRGMHSLIERLGQRSNIELHVGEEVESIEKTGVVANGSFYEIDQIFSALPLQTIGKLTGLWVDAEAQDLVVAHLAYRGVKLPKEGIGYLIPSKEKEKLLGMIWESSLFPEQGPADVVRITGILREGGVEVLRDAMARHLSVREEPIFATSSLVKGAIPRFFVGYHKRLLQFEQDVRKKFPNVELLGNYRSNPSVEGCIYPTLKC